VVFIPLIFHLCRLKKNNIFQTQFAEDPCIGEVSIYFGKELNDFLYSTMEKTRKALYFVCQFLEEQGYTQTLRKLTSESGFDYGAESHSSSISSGALMALIDSTLDDERPSNQRQHMLPVGDDQFVNEEYCCLSGFSSGANIITSILRSDGVLASACSGKQLYVFELGNDIKRTVSEAIPRSFDHHSAAVLALDFHPVDKDLFITGGMDRVVCVWSLKCSERPLASFQNHSKYVVRVKWSSSGKYFATASYDRSVCVYRQQENDDNGGFELIKTLQHPGCVEAISFRKHEDILIVAVRNDNRLWIYDLTKENITECTFLNMNAFGDDYVSFTAMDLSLSPDGQYLLVSTDQHRIILFHISSGDQVGNYYGVLNDEYSQPRRCWHPSGLYFYSVCLLCKFTGYWISVNSYCMQIHSNTKLSKKPFIVDIINVGGLGI